MSHLSPLGATRTDVSDARTTVTDSDALDNPREGVDTSRKAYLLHEHVRVRVTDLW
jgi:hypothetical protein